MAQVFPGGPEAPEYSSLRTSAGTMAPNLQLQANQTGNNMLRQQALSTNYSPWAQMAMQNMGSQQAVSKEGAAREAAMNRLALAKNPGGAMGAFQAMRGNMKSMQDAQKQNNSDMMKLKIQEQGDKTSLLKQQVANDLNALRPQEFNITNAIQDKRQQDMRDFGNWQEQMKAWAATQQARAQIEAGKK